MSSIVRPLFTGLVSFLLTLLASVSTAQTPSAEQIDAFRNLTPEQQQALMQQMGGSQRNGGAASAGSSNAQQQPGAERQQDALLDADRRQRQRAGEDREPLIPVMKPEDTVLVQVTLPEKRIVMPTQQDPLQQQMAPPAAPMQQLPGNVSPSLQQTASGPYVEPVELEVAERRKLNELVDLIRSRNPYRLDKDGRISLPGFVPIPIGGLTEMQATQRISAEPALLKLEVKLTRLPLAKSGIEGLKRFGYDLFDEAPSTFSPVTDLPVPADYVVGAGDELNVQLFGGQNRSLRLVVNRDGSVSFPELGPIRVAGQTFNAARQTIESRVAQQMIGVRASVSMGEVRSVRVFVLGEAKLPGSYTVSGLGTMTTALFASGGIKPIGSLRDIQLKRQGQLVRRLDLYDLLIDGNTSDDAKLLPGDVIFIPPVGPTVTVEGEVKRPAIYEVRPDTSLTDLIAIAGGLSSEADPARASLTRIDESSRRVVLQASLVASSAATTAIRNGDVLRVARLRPQLDSGVVVDGFVHRPGPFAWRQGLRLSDIIGSVDELRPNADANYILIRRESSPDRRISVLSADLVAALAAPGSDADVQLAPRDRITVFDLEPGRERIIKPLLEELRLQSALSRPTEVVRVEGKVKAPGEYPLETGMRVSDLLRAGGNLDAAAFGGKAELARYAVTESGARQTELIEVDLEALRRGNPTADLELKPFDYLLIKETPDWDNQESVSLKGEVRFPGVYPIRRGETLGELLERAGGLSTLAFPQGAAFTRRELKEREQKQLNQLAERMQVDIASMSLQAAAANQAGASQALLAGQQVMSQLKNTKAVGRLVIDLPAVVAGKPGGARDIALRDGDELVVPRERQEVTVIGEVQSTTSHTYARNLKRDDYIALSGGATRKADRGRTYVVRADGSVVSERRGVFTRGYDVSIQPGDTIVVPIDTERMPTLPLWQAITQVIYNLAISVAAINSF